MIKLADTLAPMADFPAVEAKDVAFSDDKTLQEKYDNGELGGSGSGSISITVDTDMSSTSTNPVQNKVIKEYIDTINTDIENIKTEIGSKVLYNKFKNTELDYGLFNYSNENGLSVSVGQQLTFNSKDSRIECDIETGVFKLKGGRKYFIGVNLRTMHGSCLYKLCKNNDYNTICTGFKNASDYTQSTWSDKELNWIISESEDQEYRICIGEVYNSCKISSYQLYIVEIGRETVIDPVEYVNTNNGIEDTPVGHIITYKGTAAPAHYLICDGSEYNISDYPHLSQHFKDEFGSYNYFGGDGINTFAIPKLNNFDMTSELFDSIDKTYISSEPYESFTAKKAFDNNITTYFHTYNVTPIYLGFITSNPVSFNQYSITNRHNSYETRSIKNFELQATEDGTQWDTIDIQTNLIWTGNSETKTFDIELNKSYIGYRIYTEENVEISIAELKFLSKPIITELYCIKYEPTYYMQNTFNTNDVYSTEEMIVGRWIDGKPLYKKTFIHDSAIAANSDLVWGTIEDIDVGFIDGAGSYFINSNPDVTTVGSMLPLNVSGKNSSILAYTVYTSVGKNITSYFGNDAYGSKGVCTVKYTKTTDTSLEGTINSTTCNCTSYTDEEIQEEISNVLGGVN